MGIGLSPEPQSLVLELLRNIRADVARVEDNLQSEIRSLRADVAADLVVVNARINVGRKETSEQIAGLRRAVVEYHSAVLGHGMLIGDSKRACAASSSIYSLPAMDAN